eukprot:2585618-Pyramimonas_sp.AAC.1
MKFENNYSALRGAAQATRRALRLRASLQGVQDTDQDTCEVLGCIHVEQGANRAEIVMQVSQATAQDICEDQDSNRTAMSAKQNEGQMCE